MFRKIDLLSKLPRQALRGSLYTTPNENSSSDSQKRLKDHLEGDKDGQQWQDASTTDMKIW